MSQTGKFIVVLTAAFLTLAGCRQQQPIIPKLLPLPSKLNLPEDHWTTTADNWSLHLRHYPPAAIDPDRMPVILCHGLSHNNNYWDLAESVSLAKYLQVEGFDVWAVSLRGTGQSTKPTLSNIKQLFRLEVSVFNPKGVVNRQPGLLKLNWTVDDHIQRDIPAAIDYVMKKTGKPQVFWIGHSMGSMIMFAYLATIDQSKVKGFIALAAPMHLVRPSNDIYELMATNADFVKIGNLTTGTNYRAIVGVLAGPFVNTPIDQLFLNESNVDPELLRVFYYANQEDISPGQLDQLLQYLKTGSFSSYDGKTNYTNTAHKITVPVLQVLGQLDNMISPGDAAAFHQTLGSKDKQFRVFGRINGYRADYGHDDIVIGKYARDEVFPYLRDWLIAQSRPPGKSLLPFLTTRPVKGKKQ